MTLKTARIAATACPYCGYKIDSASRPGRSQPIPGDVMMCLNCAKMSIMGDAGELRRPTREEVEEIKQDAELDLEIAAYRATLTAAATDYEKRTGKRWKR